MILASQSSTLSQFILALMLACFVMGQDLSPQFPKIIWIYTEEGDLDELEKLCLNNIMHFAKQSKYELRVVTDRNLTQYLNATSLNE
jgi:hypothetical protein